MHSRTTPPSTRPVQAKASGPVSSPSAGHHPVITAQQGLGNQGLLRLLQRQTAGKPATTAQGSKQTNQPYYPGMFGLSLGRFMGVSRWWYPHDYKGPMLTPYTKESPKNVGYKVPGSQDPAYNCMYWAIGPGIQKTKGRLPPRGTWKRTTSLPWPEETYLTSLGYQKTTASASHPHKVTLYELRTKDEFHILRQEKDGCWSAKAGKTHLWRGITDPDAHSQLMYDKLPLSQMRRSFWYR